MLSLNAFVFAYMVCVSLWKRLAQVGQMPTNKHWMNQFCSDICVACCLQLQIVLLLIMLHVVGLQVLDHAKTTKFECNKIIWSRAHVLAGKGKFVEIPLRWFIYVCFFVLSAVCECVCAPCKWFAVSICGNWKLVTDWLKQFICLKCRPNENSGNVAPNTALVVQGSSRADFNAARILWN